MAPSAGPISLTADARPVLPLIMNYMLASLQQGKHLHSLGLRARTSLPYLFEWWKLSDIFANDRRRVQRRLCTPVTVLVNCRDVFLQLRAVCSGLHTLFPYSAHVEAAIQRRMWWHLCCRAATPVPHVDVMQSLLRLYVVTWRLSAEVPFEWRHGNAELLRRLGHCRPSDAIFVDDIRNYAMECPSPESAMYSLDDEDELDATSYEL